MTEEVSPPIVPLEQLKTLLGAFAFQLAEQKSEVLLVVESIERIRQQATDPLIASDAALRRISEYLVVFTEKAFLMLSDDTLDGLQASYQFRKIQDPSPSQVVVEINAYIYRQTNDLRTFLQP